jgi:hypothetical protein
MLVGSGMGSGDFPLLTTFCIQKAFAAPGMWPPRGTPSPGLVSVYTDQDELDSFLGLLTMDIGLYATYVPCARSVCAGFRV